MLLMMAKLLAYRIMPKPYQSQTDFQKNVLNSHCYKMTEEAQEGTRLEKGVWK